MENKLKIFEEFPDQVRCILCDTNKKGKCILIPICGEQDGFNVEAAPVHLDCIDLWYDKKASLIFQRVTQNGQKKGTDSGE